MSTQLIFLMAGTASIGSQEVHGILRLGGTLPFGKQRPWHWAAASSMEVCLDHSLIATRPPSVVRCLRGHAVLMK